MKLTERGSSDGSAFYAPLQRRVRIRSDLSKVFIGVIYLEDEFGRVGFYVYAGITIATPICDECLPRPIS